MPAKWKARQKAAGAALAAKRGEIKKSELKGASREMVESMTEENSKNWRAAPARANRSTPKAAEYRMPLPDQVTK